MRLELRQIHPFASQLYRDGEPVPGFVIQYNRPPKEHEIEGFLRSAQITLRKRENESQ